MWPQPVSVTAEPQGGEAAHIDVLLVVGGRAVFDLGVEAYRAGALDVVATMVY